MARTTPADEKRTVRRQSPGPAGAATAVPDYPLPAYVDSLLEQLQAHVPKALKEWDEEAVHQARVSTRRLKAALDLLKPVLTKRPRRAFGRVLRRLRRRLGPLRDTDVMLGHLGLLAKIPRHAAAAGWLSQHLCRQRGELREASAKAPPPARVLSKLGTWWPVREEVLEAREAVPSLLAESLHLQLDAFAEQSNRLVGDIANRALPAPPEESAAGPVAPTPERAAEPSDAAKPQAAAHQDPHELRIAGKLLRYTLEMAAVQGYELPKSVTKTFKRMQEALGLWHDFVVLSDRALQLSLDEALGHRDPGLQEQVLELARVFLRRSAQQLDGFARLWTEEGRELASLIRAAFPLTQPPGPEEPIADEAQAETLSEWKTDPGPPGSEPGADPEACPPASPSAA
jgi:CHAD domain-containing protein